MGTGDPMFTAWKNANKLTDEETERLQKDLAHTCSPDEVKQRIARAKVLRAEMMRPKKS